jgi:hypothetical protein
VGGWEEEEMESRKRFSSPDGNMLNLLDRRSLHVLEVCVCVCGCLYSGFAIRVAKQLTLFVLFFFWSVCIFEQLIVDLIAEIVLWVFLGFFFPHPLPVVFFLLIVSMACFNPEYSDPMKGWILRCLSDEGGIHRCRLVGTEV